MAFTKPPARRGTGDFFPVAKRPYTRKPTGPGSDNSPYYYGGGGRKPGPLVPKPDRAPGLAPGQATPNYGTMPTPQAQQAIAAATAATAAGAKADALSQYLAGITDPAERAYVAAQIGPQIAALNAQRDTLNRQAASQQAALQGFTQALIEHIKGIDYSGQYADIANSQVAAGQAAGESLAAANPQGGTEAILNAIGAPGQQAADLEKLNRDVFTGGGAVLTGTGGTIPSFQTAGEGVGVLGWAAAQPGIAAATGEENMRQLLASEAEAQGKVSTDLQAVLAGIPKAQADFATQQAQAKTDAENRAMSLYNSGLITQRELARQLKLPNWQKYPDTPRGDASKPIIKTRPDGSIVAIDPTTLKTTQVAGPNAKPKAPQRPQTGRYHATPGGDVIDTVTGQVTGYVTVKPTAPGKPTYWTDKTTGDRHMTTGNGVDRVIVPGTAQTKSGGRKATAKQMEQARLKLRQVNQQISFDPLKTMTAGQKQAIVDKWNKAHEGKTDSKGNAFRVLTPELLDAMTPAQLAALGVKTRKKYTPQDAYLDMIALGVPWRQALAMVRAKYRGFGQGYDPKGDAATETAAYSLPSSASSEFATVDAEGAPDAHGTRHHAAYDWMLGPNASVPSLVSGTVIGVTPSRGNSGQVFGGVVKILTADGRVLVYRHVNPNVRVGQKVGAGDSVASTVRWADNPSSSHAHIEYWKSQSGGYRYENMLDPTVAFRGSGNDTQYASDTSARSPQSARALGKTMASGYGWNGNEWSALNQLWTHESGWDYRSHNKKGSGAQGIPQALGHSLPSDYATNPRTQIEWGLNYIKNTFRTPSRAWAFWRATVNRNANLAPPDLRAKAQYWIAHGYTGY